MYGSFNNDIAHAYLLFFLQVLRNPDLDKESSRDDKENKEDKDKFSSKDLKNRNKRDEKIREKSSRDRESKSIVKGYKERIDERNKDREIKQKRYDDKKFYGRRDDREYVKEERRNDLKDDRRYETREDRKVEEKRGKSYEKMRQEKKKLAETKKHMIDANVSNVSPKKMKEENDIVSERKDVEESTLEDDLKGVKDDIYVQCDTIEYRVRDIAQNHTTKLETNVANAGKIFNYFYII